MARDLIPLDAASRFVCEACGGTGQRHNWGETFGCLTCDRTGHRPHPPTVAALAPWASLGWRPTDDGHPGIAGAEEWAREIGDPRRVWWRVGAPEGSIAPGYGDRSPMGRLARAGLLWGWAGGAADRVTLYVPPLGA